MAERKAAGTAQRDVPAVSRAIRILRRLGSASAPMGVNQLARELDLVPSTCLHILRVLTDEGLTAFDPASKRYTIGVGILAIARTAIQRNDFTTLAQPKLTALSEAHGVTSMATQLIQDREMVVVALSMAQLPFRLSTELGSRFPALTSATGRCVAAFGAIGAAELRARFDRLKWDNAPDFKTWLAQVEQTRRDGYGVDAGEYISGVTIVAAPMFDVDGGVARSLVAIGLSERMSAASIAAIAASLLDVRDSVAGLLVNDDATARPRR